MRHLTIVAGMAVLVNGIASARADSIFNNNVPVTSGLILRLDGTSTSTISLSGANVTGWANAIGGPLVATQGTVARQPTYLATGTGLPTGRGVVVFDGSATAGLGDRLGLTGFNPGSNMTAFVVAQNVAQGDDVGSCCRPFFSENTASVPGGFNDAGYGLGLTRPGVGSDLRFDRANMGGITNNFTSDIGAPDSLFHIFSVQSGSSGSPSGSLYDDGTLLGNFTITAAPTGTSYTIGANVNVDARHYLGQIAEILIYDRVLTGAEHGLVGSYLEYKYGLNTAFADVNFDIQATVPEPSAFALFGLAITAGGWIRWRRR